MLILHHNNVPANTELLQAIFGQEQTQVIFKPMESIPLYHALRFFLFTIWW
jgi:hypothetical protein